VAAINNLVLLKKSSREGNYPALCSGAGRVLLRTPKGLWVIQLGAISNLSNSILKNKRNQGRTPHPFQKGDIFRKDAMMAGIFSMTKSTSSSVL